MALVSYDVLCLSQSSLRGDLVLTAVRECPMALEFASDMLRKDHDFIVNAVRVSARAAGCVAEETASPRRGLLTLSCIPSSILQSRSVGKKELRQEELG